MTSAWPEIPMLRVTQADASSDGASEVHMFCINVTGTQKKSKQVVFMDFVFLDTRQRDSRDL